MSDHSPRGMAREKYVIRARDSGSRVGREWEGEEERGGGGGTWSERSGIVRSVGCLAGCWSESFLKAGFPRGVRRVYPRCRAVKYTSLVDQIKRRPVDLRFLYPS